MFFDLRRLVDLLEDEVPPLREGPGDLSSGLDFWGTKTTTPYEPSLGRVGTTRVWRLDVFDTLFFYTQQISGIQTPLNDTEVVLYLWYSVCENQTREG